jgi:hypothetical protein
MSGKNMRVEGAIMLVPEIIDNGALSSLSLKCTKLISHSDQGKAAGKALGDMLAVNTVLTELDLSSNGEYRSTGGVGFAQELAVGLKDNGALSVANVMGNRIGKKQLAKLQEIMHSLPNLVSLCGITDDAIEADLSGLGMDADDAAVLASELPDKGAMTSLNLAENYMDDDGAKHIAAAIKVIHCVLALILTLFSCPSDFLFNCWCLLLSAGYEGTIVVESCVKLYRC